MWFTPLDIQKALDSRTASGQNLIPEVIDPYIAELVTRVSPLRNIIPRRPWKSGTYDKNIRTGLGQARYIGDGMTSPESGSTITRFQEKLKINMIKGAVSGFLQDASQEHIDALKTEVKGHTTSIGFEEEFATLYGNASADEYQPNGIDTWVKTNVFDINAPVGFDVIDTGINAVLNRTAKPACIVMSINMQSRLSNLLMNQQRFLDKIEIAGGVKLLSYRDIPIYATSFIGANKPWTGGLVTASALAGGSLPVGSYFYEVVAVLQNGDTLPCAEVTASSAATNNTIKIEWTAPAISGSVRLYKIYRGTSTGTAKLLTVIPGVAYRVKDDIIGTIEMSDIIEFRDLGVYGSMVVSFADARVTGYNYRPTDAKLNERPNGANQEDIHIITTEAPVEGGDACAVQELKAIGYMPLAKIANKDWFLILGYNCLTMIEQFSAKLSRVSIT